MLGQNIYELHFSVVLIIGNSRLLGNFVTIDIGRF